MQSTGAVLLAVQQCGLPCMWLLTQDSRSAHGLLYLAAVWDDGRKQEHCQGRINISSASLATPDRCKPMAPLGRLVILGVLIRSDWRGYGVSLL